MVAAVVAVTLSAGCGLPTTSPVLPGRRVDEVVVPGVRTIVPPPVPGATPEAIIRGFIRAGIEFQATESTQPVVGVEYLARDSVERWRPLSAVTVFDRTAVPSVTQQPDGRWRVEVAAVAGVDQDGRYREVPAGTVVSADMELVQVDGEWRIRLPATGFGIWVSTDDFGRLFEPFRIAYLAPWAQRLVSDVRWFPSGPRVATALARAQLAAIPEYLQGAVTTGIPSDTRLAVDAVEVQNRVATVTLSASAQAADPQARRAMWAQFIATLTQGLTGVDEVQLEVQGAGPLLVPGLDSPASSVEELGYVPDGVPPPTIAALRRANQVVRIDPARLDQSDQGVQRGAGADFPAIPPGFRDIAVAGDGSELAVRSQDGTEVVRLRSGSQQRVVGLAGPVTRPGYDGTGRLWISGVVAGAARVWAVDATTDGAGPQPVAADWLAGRVVVDLRPSPDGVRVAVVSRLPDDSGYRLDIAGVIRDPSGKPVGLARPYRQGEPLGRFATVSWLDTLTMAVLGRQTDADPLRPFLVDLGQGVGLRRRGGEAEVTLIASVPGAQTVTSVTGGARGLVVVTGSPAVFTRAGSAWQVVPGAVELAVAGR